MAVVVVDSGPLIALAKTDTLGVLRDLFGRCWLPEAVRVECFAREGADARRIERALEAGWLLVRAAPASSSAYPPSLGAGEVEAMRLGESIEDALLIVDDRLARREAHRRQVAYMGTARVLLLAEQRGLIDNADPVVERMAAHGYRISHSILQDLRHRGLGRRV